MVQTFARVAGTRSPILSAGTANTVPDPLIGELRRGVVHSFTEAAFQLLHPGPRITTLNEPDQEAEPLSYVAAIATNVALGGIRVDGQKFGPDGGPREEIGRVAELRRFHDNRPLKIEDVLRPKQL